MLLHASCVSVDGSAVLLVGPPGVGKSDVALRLIDGGASLVADDQTLLHIEDGRVLASPPTTIAGMMEVRHVGLMTLPFVDAAPVKLYVELCGLDEKIERLPEINLIFLLDRPVQRLRLPGLAASTSAKIRSALLYAKINDRDTKI